MIMQKENSQLFQKNNLVLYKSSAARIIDISHKIEIELDSKKRVKVRNKDITLLHPGPIESFSELKPINGEIEEVCKTFSGESVTLPELAELIYAEYTVSSSWATYKLLQDELYFYGTPEKIHIRTKDDLEKEIQSRKQKNEEQVKWEEFINRIRNNKIHEDDKNKCNSLRDFAYGREKKNTILKELSIQQTPENAHRLLIKLKIWDETVNPYIKRLKFTIPTHFPDIPEIEKEKRLDLTYLEAFAIDDEGNKDPDDAISIDGNKIWVHIADVASLVTPDSPLDNHAQAMCANLYLPEKTVKMLPEKITSLFGLGLKEISSALSFGMTLDDDGQLNDIEIVPTLIKVTRLTYQQAEHKLQSSPLKKIYNLIQKYQNYRRSRNCVFLTFPEVKIKVYENIVSINQLPDLRSRQLVTESMVMAGEASARFAYKRKIPFPYVSQPPPETIDHPKDLAAMFAYRKLLKPGETHTLPAPHSGLGLKMYSRSTSPLRRYIDLIAHQQLRAYINNKQLMDDQTIVNRVGSYEALIGNINKLERLSNLHWTLVYLHQNPTWQGRGIVVDIKDRFAVIIIPELGMETRMAINRNLSLNNVFTLKVTSIDIPSLSTHFQVIDG
jgi:exoribonuclease-2